MLLFGLGFSTVYGESKSGGFRIFKVKVISAEEGRKLLSQTGIGSVSQFPGSAAVLVTGSPEDIAKAETFLGLVDVQRKYSVKVMGKSLKANILPSSEAIAEKLSGMSVGTFASPPDAKSGSPVIVDIHNGSLVMVAQESRLDRVVAAVGELFKEKKAAAGGAETPSEPTQPGPKPIEAKPGPEQVAPIQPKVEKIEVIKAVDPNSPRKGLTRPTPPLPVTTSPRPRPGTVQALKPDKKQTPPTVKVVSSQNAGGMYTPSTPPSVRGDLKITLPQKLDIVSLLQFAGEYLDLNFMYDPTKIKGEVTILWTGNQKGTIKVSELYPLLESILQFHGFAMTRTPGANMVRVTLKADSIDPPIIEDMGDQIKEFGNVVVTRIFKLEHIDAASAQNLLSVMQLANVSPVGDAKMLFVTGYAFRMPRVERLLKMVDKPGKPKKIKFRTCKFTMATALAPKVKTLAEQLGTVQITVGQMASPSRSAPTSTQRRPGETTAAYTKRLAEERARRTQPSAASRTSSAAVAPGVYLDADERTNRILMIGFEEELDSVEELIDTLDVEQTDLRTLKVYEIKHIDADQARKKLQELGIVSGSGLSSSSSSSRITGGTRVGAATKSTAPPASRAPASTMASTSGRASQGLVEEPTVVIIEPTNSLLVNATAEQHAQVELILKYVDAETDTRTIPYVIYPLENQKPEDLAGILEKLIQETVKDKEGKIEQVVKKTDEDIVIVPDENTFSVIVYASKKNQEWIKNLIETLDKRRPQVLIDVTLVEVWKTDEFTYNLNLIESLPDLAHTAGFTSSIGGKTSGEIFNALKSSDRARFMDFQVDSGSGTGFYGDSHVQALLRLVQTQNHGRILAKPKVLVNDNETGNISTTKTTYIKKTSSIPVATAGAGNQGTLVQTAVDYQGYDSGIQLDITPHISEGDLLRLEITLTRSDFQEAASGGETDTSEPKPPDTVSSDITTVVTVPDGSTIILGGMTKLDQSKGGSKVPLLGDLPLVGVLFRSAGNKERQEKLYIFVKAEIIRPAETLGEGLPDLERLSQRNRLAFERSEQEFQNYKNFPGIKAKPKRPERVLELE
ncbi:MAG: secretin N-terminal domain-containing protein [Planctomycetota bacterium]|jgi:type II secretory pathway component GspD/PulD (secretin)